MTKKLLFRVAQDVVNIESFFPEDELLNCAFCDALYDFSLWVWDTYSGREYQMEPADIHFQQAVDNFCTDIAQLCSMIQEMPQPEREVTLSMARVVEMLWAGSHGLTDFFDLYPSSW